MSTKKEVWRLLEPGVDVWQEGDEFCTDAGNWAPSVMQGSIVLSTQYVGRRCMTIPEPQGWVSVKERMPTKEDAGAQDCVLWMFASKSIIAACWDKQWVVLKASHWMMIPNDPVEDLNKEAWEKVKQEMIASNPGLGNATVHWGLIEDAFKRGRKSAATESEAL